MSLVLLSENSFSEGQKTSGASSPIIKTESGDIKIIYGRESEANEKAISEDICFTGNYNLNKVDFKKIVLCYKKEIKKMERRCKRNSPNLPILESTDIGNKSNQGRRTQAINAFQHLPKIWSGYSNDNGSRSTKMIMQIDELSGDNFFGKVNFPGYDTIVSLRGKIVDKKMLNDFVDRTRWEYVKKYNGNKKSKNYIQFSFDKYLEGNQIVLSNIYYASIEDFTIKGVEFSTKDRNYKKGTFSLSLER